MKKTGIYTITRRETGQCYVGIDGNLPRRVQAHLSGNSKACKRIHDAIMTYGVDAFDVEIILYPGISRKALCEVEKWKIRQLNAHHSKGGYNLTGGGGGKAQKGEYWDEADKIVEMHNNGMSCRQIGKVFGVHSSTIGEIIRSKGGDVVWGGRFYGNGNPKETADVLRAREASDDIIELYLKGKSLRVIGDLYNISSTPIRKILLANGILTRVGSAKRSSIWGDDVRVVRLYEQGHRIRDIAQRYKVSNATVLKVLKSKKVSMRKRGERSKCL